MNKLTNDLIAAEDVLERKPFAKNIVQSIVQSSAVVDESIVVGICGKWGSGKSTLIHFIETEIKNYYAADTTSYKIIQFNSWANSSENDLQRSLLETILRNIEKTSWKKTVRAASDKIAKYLRYLEYVKYLKYTHPVVSNWFSGIDQLRQKKNILSVDELKDSVNDLIRTNKIKLFITIDDLDRLDHKEIVTVFKALKLSVNFLNTTFFVAYDKQVVVNALKDTYGENAEEYLEKIIQVDFAVPELLDEQVENLFFDRIRDILKLNEIEVKEADIFSLWKYHGLRLCFQNPRDVKRYTNSLILSLPNVKNNVNALDFLALEAIKVFDYNAYNQLYEGLLDHKRASIMRNSDIRREYLDKINTTISKSLIDYLFNNHPGANMFNAGLIHKRLKDTEFFQRYFTLSISLRDITEEEFVNFVNAGTSKTQILGTAYDNGRIKNLLRRIGDPSLRENMLFKDEYIFRDFLNFWDNYKVISSDLDELLWHAYFNMANSFADRLKGAKRAIEELEMSLNSDQPMRLLFNHLIFANLREGKMDSAYYQALYDEIKINEGRLFNSFIGNMKKTCGNYFHKINNRTDDYTCVLFLESFVTYCTEEYNDQVKHSIDKLPFIIFMLRHFLLRIDVISERPFDIEYSKTNILLPGDLFDKFLQQLNDIKTSLLSENEKELVEYFKTNNIL